MSIDKATAVLLAETVFNLVDSDAEGCVCCPAYPECQNGNDPELYGTECVAIILGWAQEEVLYARRDKNGA